MQSAGEEEPVEVITPPYPQAVHAVAPGKTEYVLKGQLVHVEMSEAPVAFEYVPGGHRVALIEPSGQ
jgi:hypothetical protein